MEMDFFIEKLVFVTSHRLFVAYCDDITLRLYGDIVQDLTFLTCVQCPSSVISMHYNEESEELITGCVGHIVFWSFKKEQHSFIAISKILDWSSCSLERGEFVNYLITERQSNSLFALCGNRILAFDYWKKVETKPFQGSSCGTLKCCSPCWVQRYLYTGDASGYVQIWSRENRNLLQEFKAHSGAITSLLIRPKVHSFLTASTDRSVKEWNFSGELLQRLIMDKEILQFQSIDDDLFLCHMPYSFSIWNLRTFYQLFNATDCPLQKICRVQCTPTKARMLAITKDGIVRFLSPVTGELILLSWPLLILEKATDYAYDPQREEMFIATGSSEMLVLDTSICPSPAKYFLITSEDQADGVLCLRAVRITLSKQSSPFLIFSGHQSGKIMLLSPRSFSMHGKKAHDGKILQMSSLSTDQVERNAPAQLCSYGTDDCISLWFISRKDNHIDLIPSTSIACSCKHLYIRLIPGHVCTISGKNTLMLFKITGYPFECLETEETHMRQVSSIDYCFALKIIVTGGTEGSIKIWDLRGNMLAELKLQDHLSYVCFANQRGDLLANSNSNTYYIPCFKYLTGHYLKTLICKEVQDDAIEDPLPFKPHSLKRLDVVLVPKYYLDSKSCTEDPDTSLVQNKFPVSPRVQGVPGKYLKRSRKPLTAELLPAALRQEVDNKMERPLMIEAKKLYPASEHLHGQPEDTSKEEEFSADMPIKDHQDLEYKKIAISESKSPTWDKECAPYFRKWPVAPDGYIPNSVIRAWIEKYKYPTSLPDTDKQKYDPSQLMACFKEADIEYGSSRTLFLKEYLDEYDEAQAEDDHETSASEDMCQEYAEKKEPDLLTRIAESNWLSNKPFVIDIDNVIQAILLTMHTDSSPVYCLCTDALLSIAQTYTILKNSKDDIIKRLLADTTDERSNWKKLEAWKTLDQLNYLAQNMVPNLAQGLMDHDAPVRTLVRALLKKLTTIQSKETLLHVLEKLLQGFPSPLHPASQTQDPNSPHRAGFSIRLLQELEEKLQEDLTLKGPGVPVLKVTSRFTEVERLPGADSLPTQGLSYTGDLDGGASILSSGICGQVPGTLSLMKFPQERPDFVPQRDDTDYGDGVSKSKYTLGTSETRRGRGTATGRGSEQEKKKQRSLKAIESSSRVRLPPLQRKGSKLMDSMAIHMYISKAKPHEQQKRLSVKVSPQAGQQIPDLEPMQVSDSALKKQSDPKAAPPSSRRTFICSQSVTAFPSIRKAALEKAGQASAFIKIDPTARNTSPNSWRESLYELVSMYGLKSLMRRGKGASQFSTAASTKKTQEVVSVLGQIKDVAPGQRVLHRILVRDPNVRPESGFHLEFPLSWKQSFQTMSPHGDCGYGMLELDWTTGLKTPPRDIPKMNFTSTNH
ncbi:WD repeat-containing protein 87-like [Polyodon spathula]|uniref:WD repeat-containing protein 87-like n=1 Tax=Polyodon spathula TaxID=7913 RepID=UPI001B7F1241|nr:WD repeat-containing protein 87-like [Polyodon spathula]